MLPLVELRQESQIIVKKHADIGNAVLQHCYSFHSKAEGETGNGFRIVADILKNYRVHHSCTEDFQPTAILTNPTALATADDTSDIHLCAWLGEWKITGPEPHLCI